jgi:hypothetical protein
LQKAAVADLQKHWKCALHSKNSDTFCWQSDEGICYELLYQQIGFWAIEMVSITHQLIRLY